MGEEIMAIDSNSYYGYGAIIYINSQVWNDGKKNVSF